MLSRNCISRDEQRVKAASDAVDFLLQKVWQLAGPVLVAQSSIDNELRGKSTNQKQAIWSKTWWRVLETTRHMLAHRSLLRIGYHSWDQLLEDRLRSF
jgi:hypothetical protein